jgi:hypothetical protein
MRAANDDNHGGRVAVVFTAIGPDDIPAAYRASPGERFARGMLWGASFVAVLLVCASVGAQYVGG